MEWKDQQEAYRAGILAGSCTPMSTRDIVLAIMRSSDLKRVSADRVADRMGIKRWALDKRLSREGTSYKACMDLVRIEKVRNIRGKQAKEVYGDFGFSDPEYFGKWFKRTFGQTWIDWRLENAA